MTSTAFPKKPSIMARWTHLRARTMSTMRARNWGPSMGPQVRVFLTLFSSRGKETHTHACTGHNYQTGARVREDLYASGGLRIPLCASPQIYLVRLFAFPHLSLFHAQNPQDSETGTRTHEDTRRWVCATTSPCKDPLQPQFLSGMRPRSLFFILFSVTITTIRGMQTRCECKKAHDADINAATP